MPTKAVIVVPSIPFAQSGLSVLCPLCDTPSLCSTEFEESGSTHASSTTGD